MSKSNSFALAVIRGPLVWGGLATLGFYATIHAGLLESEFVQRYFASHPVEYLTVAMFFVGMAALIVKALDVASQATGLEQPLLGAVPPDGNSIDDVPSLVDKLKNTPARLQNSYLVRRIREALLYVRRKGSADHLDEHLRYASDVDLGRMHASYSLVRIIIWAIPILGFLGTVIGITLAIAKLGPQDLENSLPQVVNGLKIAFDTTALSLALSIVLMFAQFLADRIETSLLSRVDDRVAAELVGRFQEYGAGADPQVASIRRMAETVVQSTENLVERQAALWQTTIDSASEHWIGLAARTAEQLESTLHDALGKSLERHAEVLTASSRQYTEAFTAAQTKHADILAASEERHARLLADSETSRAEKLAALDLSADAKHRQHWHDIAAALDRSTDAVTKQHEQLVRQGEIMRQAIEAAGQVQSLESTLNENLAALSGARNFEETVMSLSAAIQLLSTQLHGKSNMPRVDLRADKPISNAA